MKGHKTPFTLFFTMLQMISFSSLVFSQIPRADFQNYKEKNLIAPNFSLKALDGKTYNLSDYRGKQIVVIQTGSST